MKKKILLVGGSSGIGLELAKILKDDCELYTASRSAGLAACRARADVDPPGEAAAPLVLALGHGVEVDRGGHQCGPDSVRTASAIAATVCSGR